MHDWYSNNQYNRVTGFGEALVSNNTPYIEGSAVYGTVDLSKLEITIPPTLNMVITAQRTGGASGDVTATLTWYEDV